MANFELASEVTANNEGGYVNDPLDPGGETYEGISRFHNPGWIGWQSIDTVPMAKRNTETLSAMLELKKLVDDFYKKQFWDVNSLDEVCEQSAANAIYDCGVLFHPKTAAAWAQLSLNALNQGGISWPDLICDGQLGKKSIACLNICCGDHSPNRARFQSCLSAFRITHHLNSLTSRPSNERFFIGWLDRSVRMESNG